MTAEPTRVESEPLPPLSELFEEAFELTIKAGRLDLFEALLAEIDRLDRVGRSGGRW